jgi:hypothetical protein
MIGPDLSISCRRRGPAMTASRRPRETLATSARMTSHKGAEEEKRQTACKPGSVPGCPGDGHSSGTSVAGRLVRPTRAAARKPASPKACRPYLVLLPVGFAVPSALPSTRCALTAPFHPCPRVRPTEVDWVRGRFAFCGTFPGVAPAGHYPAPYLRGARTFLPPTAFAIAGERPSGHLAQPIRRDWETPGQSRCRTSAVRRPMVSASGTPSRRAGRKCRWKAVTTAAVASSRAALCGTS